MQDKIELQMKVIEKLKEAVTRAEIELHDMQGITQPPVTYSASPPKLKPIDLKVLMENRVECQFYDADGYSTVIGQIASIKQECEIEYGSGPLKFTEVECDNGMTYPKCKPRMGHIYSAVGFDEYPLPNGFTVKFYYRHGEPSFLTSSKDWSEVIAFEIIGLASGYCWPWVV